MTEAVALKGGFTSYDRRLDRVPQWDPRNDNFSIRRLVTQTAQPRSYTWPVGARMSEQVFLDQGQEGECVGYSFAHELIAKPVRVPADAQVAHAVYAGAQKRDEWPGEDYSGTSVLAGAKYLHDKGYYKSYAWTRDAWDLAIVVSRKGPCVIGVNWYEGMFGPDGDGFLNPTGRVMGGHAILVKGVALSRPRRQSRRTATIAFTLHNSWGPDWGINGTAYLSFDDMQRLLNEEGEACLPMRNHYDMEIAW